MLNILWKELKDKKWLFIIYTITGVLFVCLYVFLYPSIQKSGANVSEIIKSLPADLNKAFGLDASSFNTLEGLLSGKHFSLIWPILLIGLSVSMAASFISGEIEKSTMEILVSEPISRLSVFTSKLISGALIVLVFVIISILVVLPLSTFSNISVIALNFYKLTFLGYLFGLAIFGISMFFSAIFSEKGKAIFATVGLLILMYVINIVSLLKDSLENIKYFSLFYYFNYTDVLVHGKLLNLNILVFLVTFLFSSFLASAYFVKRDF